MARAERAAAADAAPVVPAADAADPAVPAAAASRAAAASPADSADAADPVVPAADAAVAAADPVPDAAVPWDAPASHPSATAAAIGACSTTATPPSSSTTRRWDARSYSINGQDTPKAGLRQGTRQHDVRRTAEDSQTARRTAGHLHLQLSVEPHPQRHHQHADHADRCWNAAAISPSPSAPRVPSPFTIPLTGRSRSPATSSPPTASTRRRSACSSITHCPMRRATSRTIRRPSPPSATATTSIRA